MLANEQLNNKIQRATVQMKECAWCSEECDEKEMSHCDLRGFARDEQHFFCNGCFGPWVRNPTNHARLVVYCQTCKHGGGVEAVIIPPSDVSEGFFARKRELEEAANHERERDLAKVAPRVFAKATRKSPVVADLAAAEAEDQLREVLRALGEVVQPQRRALDFLAAQRQPAEPRRQVPAGGRGVFG